MSPTRTAISFAAGALVGVAAVALRVAAWIEEWEPGDDDAVDPDYDPATGTWTPVEDTTEPLHDLDHPTEPIIRP